VSLVATEELIKSSMMGLTFETLPPEIILLIGDQIPYHTLHALRLTHRAFASTIQPEQLARSHQKLRTQLYEQERHNRAYPPDVLNFAYSYMDTHNNVCVPADTPTPKRPIYLPKHRRSSVPRTLPRNGNISGTHGFESSTQPTLYPCYTCLLVLPAIQFAWRQISGARAPRRSQCRNRYCVDCGIRTRRWALGTRFDDHVICSICFDLRPKVRESVYYLWVDDKLVDKVHSPENEEMCDDCVEDLIRKAAKQSEVELDRRAGWNGSWPSETRSGRCQRCWATDHTIRASQESSVGQHLCVSCLSRIDQEQSRGL
jgi:hypothetical protein